MDDLIERLRHFAPEVTRPHLAALMHEAAARIEADAAEIVRLRGALRGMLTATVPQHSLRHITVDDARALARIAIKGTDNG